VGTPFEASLGGVAHLLVMRPDADPKQRAIAWVRKDWIAPRASHRIEAEPNDPGLRVFFPRSKLPLQILEKQAGKDATDVPAKALLKRDTTAGAGLGINVPAFTAPGPAAASLGARRTAIFRRIVFPNLLPAILSGVALAFARAVGEFGAVVLISGNLPFKTEMASVYIFGRLESQDTAGAASLSLVLLAISFSVLLIVGALRRWATRHDREA
jgi:hypothetical protein